MPKHCLSVPVNVHVLNFLPSHAVFKKIVVSSASAFEIPDIDQRATRNCFDPVSPLVSVEIMRHL